MRFTSRLPPVDPSSQAVATAPACSVPGASASQPGGAPSVGEACTVVAAVNDREILARNLCRSPDLQPPTAPRLLLREHFASAAAAYNSALDEADSDLVVFVHQDIYFPAGWFAALAETVAGLERRHAHWGVLGCFGASRHVWGGLGTVYTTGLGFHGNPIGEPQPAETLDEIVLVVRRSSGLRFDPALPGFHLYGTDLCLQARQRGLGVYAVPGLCVHNTNQLLALPEAYHQAYRYVKRKWSSQLPIYTPCITISRFDGAMRWRGLRQRIDRLLGRAKPPLQRIPDPRVVLASRP